MNLGLADFIPDHTVLKDPSQSPKVCSRNLRLLHGVGPADPPSSVSEGPPSPAYLAHKDQRLPELSLADGTDIAGFCALLPSGPDAVILFAVKERDKHSCGPSLEQSQRHDEICFWLLLPRTLARTT